MPEDTSEKDVYAKAAADYRSVIANYGGTSLHIGLPDCHLYMKTCDDVNPCEISIQDVEFDYKEEDYD